jgi:aerobic-type carbon monoxide dehydrogenase small subunit (CoxS/CutS family)
MEDNHKKNKSGISRRAFIRGAGLTTAGTLAIQTGVMAGTSEADKATKELGPNAVNISMNVNGRVYKLNVEPRATLAKALREELQLTGTKVVCDRGSCSACTVWLDNTPVNACMTFAMDVGEKKVTTIEGLAKNGKLHPIQEAFIEHDASQCGFCTPGMIMSTASLINQNPNPSIDDVKHATRGNYCRCGTYPHVFKATLAAAKKI